MKPGMKPAAKSFATDAPEQEEYTTNGMLGGITGPMVEEAAVIPARRCDQPASSMAFISMTPRPAASATAAPDIPEKMTEETMFT